MKLKLLTPMVIVAGALATAPVAIALPAAAAPRGTGGTGLGGASGGAAPGRARVEPGNITVTASGDGITVATTESALLRHHLEFAGTAPAGDAGDTVEIARLASRSNWLAMASAVVAPDGSFTVDWRVDQTGRLSIRAILESASTVPPPTTASRRPVGSGSAPGGVSPAPPSATPVAGPELTPTGAVSGALKITAYRPARATMYGPGFFGNRTACGQVLRRSTLGVASRTLRCGTRISIYYHGRTLVVPVIDRGPYANGADWDLTEAVARALRIPGTVTIGAVALRRG